LNFINASCSVRQINVNSFNYLFENGLFKYTAYHVHCKYGNILEMVPDRVVVNLLL